MANFPAPLSESSVSNIIQDFLNAVLPTREVVINELSDWPAAVGGVITLDSNTQYLIGTNLPSSSNRFVMGSFTVIKGIDTDNANIDYTGTGAMFTSVDKTWLIEDITLDCPNGKVFDHTDSVGRFVRTRNVCVADSDTLGDFNSTANGVWFFTNFIATNMSGGFTFTGNWNIMQFEISSDVQITGTFIDLGTTTFNSIGINGASVFLVTGASTFIKGAANSANINSGGLARVTNCVVANIGGGTILDGITVDDVRWRFLNNQDIRDSRPDALIYAQNNIAETVIAAVDTPVKVNSTFTEDHTSQFTSDASGRMTFIGEIEQRLPIDFVLDVQMASGGAKDVKAYVAINGTVVTAAHTIIPDVSGTKPKAGTVIWQHLFQTNDYVEIWVENISDAINIVVLDCVLRIN